MASRDNYIVFLRPDIGSEAVQLFSHFVRRVTFETGATLDYFACSSVTTGGPLVELTVYPPDSEVGWPFQIPTTWCSQSRAPSTRRIQLGS